MFAGNDEVIHFTDEEIRELVNLIWEWQWGVGRALLDAFNAKAEHRRLSDRPVMPVPPPAARRSSRRNANRIARAAARAADVAPIIAELQAAGVTSLNDIATALNARGIRTPRGRRY